MWYHPLPAPEIYVSTTTTADIQTIAYAGRWFTIRRLSASHGEILGLHSIDPDDYLNPAWQPGQILAWAELLQTLTVIRTA